MATGKDILVLLSKISGSQEDVKPALEKVLSVSKFSYKILRVKNPPELAELIQKHVAEYKAIAVYGGDGTVITAIKELAGARTDLLVLPGGTGNVTAADIGVPMNLTELIKHYIRGSYKILRYDTALAGGEKLALDMYLGWWATATTETSSALKKRWGQIAYGLVALKSFSKGARSKYVFEVDGKRIAASGYTAIVANRGAQHFLGLRLFPGEHRPGILRGAVLRSVSPLRFLLWAIVRGVTGKNFGGLLRTFKGNEVRIIDAPKELLFDDLESTLKVPMAVVGARYETRLVIPGGISRVSISQIFWRKVRFLTLLAEERLRLTISRRPKYQYSQLAPNLYLGGKYGPAVYGQFRRWGVGAIVNMRTSTPPKSPKDFTLLHLQTTDWSAPSLESLRQGVDFIESYISKGVGVYVHCRQGQGRGPTMAAAYLISQGFGVDEALDHIKKSRPIARPNKSQVRRLVEWSESCAVKEVSVK